MAVTILRIASRFVVTLTVSILILRCSMSYAQPRQMPTPFDALGILQDRPDRDFRNVKLEELHENLQHTVRSQSLLLFQEETLPFGFRTGLVQLVPPSRPTDAKLRVFAATNKTERDLLELSWEYRAVPLRWVTSANISDVQVPLQPFREDPDSEPSVEKVREFVAEVLQLKGAIPGLDRDYEVKLPWPDELRDGVAVTSNPDKSFFDVIWWFDRWDVAIKDDTVHILVYSRNPQVAGFDDGSKFFPDEFRQMLLKQN